MQFLGIGFLVMLFLEILSIVWVADWLGGGATLLIMVASLILGVYMLRRIGMSGVLLAAAAVRGGGQVSLYQLLWPIRYAVAALFFISPGFISTALALLLLLPIKGKPIAQSGAGGASFSGFAHSRHNGFRARPNDDDIIEGEFTVDGETPPNKRLTDQSERRP